MTTTPLTPAHRAPLAVRTAAGLALIPALALAGATPAAAHDELLSAVPAEGQSVTTAPRELSLTFSGDLTSGRGIQNLLQVRDAHGSQWQSGAAVVTGPTLSVPLCPGLPNGTYTVAYRVVYSDGHSEEQSYPFSVKDPAAPAEGTAPAGCGVAASGATGAPVTAEPATAASGSPAASSPAASSAAATAPASVPASSAPAAPDAGLPGWVIPAGLAGLAVLGAGAWALRRSASSLDRGEPARPLDAEESRTDGSHRAER